MEFIRSFLAGHNPELGSSLKTYGLLLLFSLVLTVLGRFLLGKRSTINRSISAAIGILFVYAATILLATYAPQLHWLINPLPFATISDGYVQLFSFRGAGYAAICSQVLSMVILAFLMNLADGWLPKGKHLLGWLFMRIVTIILGLLMHALVTYLFVTYLPEGLVTYAPTVLLALLLLMLLTGVLKLVVGLIVATVNPLLMILSNFFFNTLIGKKITRAVLTTVIISALVYLMETLGIVALNIATSVLYAYVPLLLALLAMWYVLHKTL